MKHTNHTWSFEGLAVRDQWYNPQILLTDPCPCDGLGLSFMTLDEAREIGSGIALKFCLSGNALNFSRGKDFGSSASFNLPSSS